MKMLINVGEDKELRESIMQMMKACITNELRSEIDKIAIAEVKKRIDSGKFTSRMDAMERKVVDDYTGWCKRSIQSAIDSAIKSTIEKEVPRQISIQVKEIIEKMDIEKLVKDSIQAHTNGDYVLRFVK